MKSRLLAKWLWQTQGAQKQKEHIEIGYKHTSNNKHDDKRPAEVHQRSAMRARDSPSNRGLIMGL